MKKILITGATSFLGIQVSKLLERSPAIHIVKTSLQGDLKNNVAPLDLLLPDKVSAFIQKEKPDTIIHLAALVDLSRDYEVAKRCFEVNLLGTLNVLEALKKNPPKKIIFASTEEVYGNNPLPFHEKQLPQPPSMYAISKVAGEQLLRIYGTELGFSTIVLRIGTFYGPGNPRHRFIPQIIQAARANQDILLNSGTKKRDYIYVGDVANAVEKAVHVKSTGYEIVNIGGGKNYSLEELADMVVNITYSSSRIVLNAFPDRIGEADEWLMNSTKAKKILGWTPQTTLATGLAYTIANFTPKQ